MSKLNQEQIERLAVTKLVSELEKDSRLQADIPVGDKAPSFDGEIKFYNLKQGEQRRKDAKLGKFQFKLKERL